MMPTRRERDKVRPDARTPKEAHALPHIVKATAFAEGH